MRLSHESLERIDPMAAASVTLVSTIALAEAGVGALLAYIAIIVVVLAGARAEDMRLKILSRSTRAATAEAEETDLFNLLTSDDDDSVGHWLKMQNKFVDFAFSILFFVYPGCSQIIFSTWDCEEFDDGTTFLRADYSIDCESTNHTFMKVYAMVMLFIYPVGVPLIYALAVFLNKTTFEGIGRIGDEIRSMRRRLELKKLKEQEDEDDEEDDAAEDGWLHVTEEQQALAEKKRMDQEAKREEVRNLMRNAVNKEGGGPAAWDADAVEWIETTQLKPMIAALLEDVCADRPDRVIPYANAWLLENYAQEAESCRAAQAGEPLLLDWMPRIDLPLNTDGVRAYLAEVYISDIMQAIFDRAIHARPDNVVAFVLDPARDDGRRRRRHPRAFARALGRRVGAVPERPDELRD